MSKVQHVEGALVRAWHDRESSRASTSRSVMRSRMWRAGALMVCCTLLASCSGGGEDATASATASASASGTVASTPGDAYTVPPRPANLEAPVRERSDDAATDAANLATYAMELYPYVLATGELEEWRVISHPDCEFCNDVIAEVEAANEYGGWTDVAFDIEDTAVFELREGNAAWRIDLLVSKSEMEIFRQSESRTIDPTLHNIQIGLNPVREDFKVWAFTILAPDTFADEDVSRMTP